MPPWRAVPGYTHKGRNYATQHRTQRLDSALVCERRCLIRGPCVRTSRQKAPGVLTTRAHEAPLRHRPTSAPLAPCPRCSRATRPRLNAPDSAGRSLTRATCLISTLSLTSLNAPDGARCPLTVPDGGPGVRGRGSVSMHLMVLDTPYARSSRFRTQGTELRNTTPHTTA